MDNLIRPGSLFYIKVHEKKTMKKEKEKRAQIKIASPCKQSRPVYDK